MLVSAQRQPSERARSTGRRPVRTLVSRLLIVGLLALGAAAAASSYVRDLLAQHGYVVAPAVAVVLFVALLLRRPARPTAVAAPEAVDVAEAADADAAETGTDRAEEVAEAAEPVAVAGSADLSQRALQLYVRSLEAALSEQDERLDDVRRSADLRAEEVLRRDRERVRATLNVMHATLSGQPGEVAAHRIDAALARIGVEPAFTRPLLSERPSGGPLVAFGAPPAPVAPVAPVVVHAPAQVEALPASAEPVAGPDGQPLADAPGADAFADRATPDPSVDDTDVLAAPQPLSPAPRRVLPVPAPPTEAAPERGRRRMRRTVGV